jgi:hypothetical protein
MDGIIFLNEPSRKMVQQKGGVRILLKMDFEWSILDANYIIRNVPYERLDAEGEIFFDLDVSLKMAMIRDLMVTNEIPHDVDFELVAEFEF